MTTRKHVTTKVMLQRARALRPWLWLLLILTLVTCSPQPSALKRVRTTGVLTVATTNSPTTCYDGPSGPTGYECDLLEGLAARLHARLELRFVANTGAVIAEIAAGRADLGAGGLNVTPARAQQVRFTQPIQYVQQQLVYRLGDPAPGDLGELRGTLAVPAGSPMAERLAELRIHYPDLNWDEPGEDGAEDLLNKVADGELTYTIANSDLIAIDQRYEPQLRVAFNLSDTQDIAWVLPKGPDNSLFDAVQAYLSQLGQTELERLRDRYFGHLDESTYQGVVRFVTDVRNVLPRYRDSFEDAGERYGLDWRLLAAIGYQESKWKPDAVSYTGVRGIMMLTSITATAMGIQDRENPTQSILGGARYIEMLLKQLPDSIEEPDRSWMALAAYNQGMGHLLDARQLTEKNGNDPNRWVDVRNTLPLLTRARWYSQTRYGYARGREAVNYVANVRSYYDLLIWMSGAAGGGAPPATDTLHAEPVKSADAPPPDPAADARR